MDKELEAKIFRLEDLLEKVSGEILANVAYERTPPAELWAKSESDINAIRDVVREIKDTMLLLKPERAPSIRRRFRAFMQPIEGFIETLKKSQGQDTNASRKALEYLRAAVTESQEFIAMARDIIRSPSEMIQEIMKLKEVYEAKEYISKVSIPGAVYARLEHLRRSMETLKLRISSLEQAIQELLKQMDKVQDEISKFHETKES